MAMLVLLKNLEQSNVLTTGAVGLTILDTFLTTSDTIHINLLSIYPMRKNHGSSFLLEKNPLLTSTSA